MEVVCGAAQICRHRNKRTSQVVVLIIRGVLEGFVDTFEPITKVNDLHMLLAWRIRRPTLHQVGYAVERLAELVQGTPVFGKGGHLRRESIT